MNRRNRKRARDADRPSAQSARDRSYESFSSSLRERGRKKRGDGGEGLNIVYPFRLFLHLLPHRIKILSYEPSKSERNSVLYAVDGEFRVNDDK